NHAQYADVVMTEVSAQLFGGQTMVERLRRVLVRSPEPEALTRWSEFGWRAAPDPGRLLAEHEQFCVVLAEFGAEVVVGGTPVEATRLVAWSYRTNGAGIAALKHALPEVDVVGLDLPHFRGAGSVLHLMSVISMLDRDLALVYPPLTPVRLLERLSERGIRTIEVPDEEFDTLGPNVLA